MINTPTKNLEEIRRIELSKFLRTRRERINPENYGLPISPRRRTPGLKREEVAQLAGVSVSWYTWLEQGRPIQVSEQVLNSIARVFQLDWAERKHLFVLAKDYYPTQELATDNTCFISSNLQQVLDVFGICPAYVMDQRWQVVAWNKSACKIFADFSTLSPRDKNLIWLLFTDPYQKELLVEWEKEAKRCLAMFRISSDQYIAEPWFNELVNSLKNISSHFRKWWDLYDIQVPQGKCKKINHPVVGPVALQPTTLLSAESPELRIMVYTPLLDEDTNKLIKLNSV
ncbi:hypothetical protein SOV_44920 [Sporomusa ovata DSM 2662]|uniref:Putative DNA-binding protein n=1 Tax=Sporomusa ovata TaxID=2378 RepID=A0A0U1KU73_9FIRM|nr:helix-turn-helix transcriptional regulator [Sporomusa ovata]EQB26880.1 putative transcriptional regulator [Sporomusa ovata DSM 2662]CQR70982.1 putative DNA-binding protein [Sporomusa ovata]